jgi:hypothetical protein
LGTRGGSLVEARFILIGRVDGGRNLHVSEDGVVHRQPIAARELT